MLFLQTIIFVWLLYQESLVARGYKFLRIDGTTKAHDRVKIVNVSFVDFQVFEKIPYSIFYAVLFSISFYSQDFQEGVGAPIFLLTSQVGGLGLTLTKADRVIVVDPAWNPRCTFSTSFIWVSLILMSTEFNDFEITNRFNVELFCVPQMMNIIKVFLVFLYALLQFPLCFLQSSIYRTSLLDFTFIS